MRSKSLIVRTGSRRFLGLFLLLGVFFEALFANEPSIQFTQVQLQANNQWYRLNVETNFYLSSIAINALQSSIPLSWCLAVQLEQVRVVWNKNLISEKYCYRIQYHALLKTYSVTHKEINYFHSMGSALNALSIIRKNNLIRAVEIKSDEKYRLQVKWQFDREALPLPLRPLSYLDPQWNLSSDWYLWTSEP
ncbi:MAG: DUF4390 domain-containing protein [Methylococcales bacterium]|nr:DUF4390 domain-containing protein [Methylococcales bacterium]